MKNNPNGLYASHIFVDESKPELVGMVPTSKKFKSEVYFKEDTPIDEKKWRLEESNSFVYGKPPEVRQAKQDDYWSCRRKLIERVNKILNCEDKVFL